MIVRSLQDAARSERRIQAESWETVRLLLENDNVGFSFDVTTIYENTVTPIWHPNHLEAVLCIEGEGEVETVDDGVVHKVKPGVIYALDKNDKHVLRANSRMRMVCVFNPPLNGKERQDKDGIHPLAEEEISA